MDTIFQSSFEEGFTDYQGIGELTVPVGWTPDWIDGNEPGVLHRPEYDRKDQWVGQPEVHSGRYAANFFTTHATHDGCLYRKFRVGKGKGVRASVWVMGISHEKDGVTDGGHGMQLGIDPTGGTDFSALTVIYGDYYSSYMKGSRFGEMEYVEGKWAQITVEAVAAEEEVTLFLHSKCDYAVDINASHWDDLTVEVGDASEVTPPKPKEIKVGELSLGQLIGLIRRVIREEGDAGSTPD
jgi:hypothetical protein